jgi:hypothetical protein
MVKNALLWHLQNALARRGVGHHNSPRPMRSLLIFVIFLALMGLLLLGAFYSYRAVARKQASKPVAAGRAAPNAGLLCSVGCGKALGMIVLIIPSFPGRGEGAGSGRSAG